MLVLRNGGFARLWVGQFLSLFADWALRALLLLWVYRLTHSGVGTSLVGLAEALPLLVLSPVAGALVDRWHRGHTMAMAVLARAALLLPLFLVTTHAQLPLIVLVTLLVNGASQFFGPAAAACTPVVVGQEQLGQANSLLSLLQSTVGLLAPAGGALLFSLLGAHGAVALLGLLYLCAAPVLATVPVPAPVGAGAAASLAEEIIAGLAYVRRRAQLVGLFSTAFVYCLGVGALTVIDVVFISRVLHLRPETVGVLYLANGAGAFGGSTLMLVAGARLARHYHHLVRWAVLANGCALLAYALAPSLSVAVVAVGAVGFLFSIALVSFITLIQLSAEDRVMGRVMSLCTMTVAAGLLISLAWGGALADLLGVRQVMGSGAVIIALCGGLSFRLVREAPTPRGAGADAADLPVAVPASPGGLEKQHGTAAATGHPGTPARSAGTHRPGSHDHTPLQQRRPSVPRGGGPERADPRPRGVGGPHPAGAWHRCYQRLRRARDWGVVRDPALQPARSQSSNCIRSAGPGLGGERPAADLPAPPASGGAYLAGTASDSVGGGRRLPRAIADRTPVP
jgi:predicted MFS family arabinose efflux permease